MTQCKIGPMTQYINGCMSSLQYSFPPSLLAGSKAGLCTQKYLAGIHQLIKVHSLAFPSNPHAILGITFH